MMVQVLAPWNRDTKKVFLYPPPKLINLNSGASCNDGRVGEMHQSGLLSIRRLYFWGLTWTLILWLPFLCLPLFLDLTSISETSSRAFAPRGGGHCGISLSWKNGIGCNGEVETFGEWKAKGGHLAIGEWGEGNGWHHPLCEVTRVGSTQWCKCAYYALGC